MSDPPEPTNDELREWASELYKDEDLDEECREILLESSDIYKQPIFKEIYAKCMKYGRNGRCFDEYAIVCEADSNWETSRDPPADPREQITVFHMACMMMDFVMVDAMIRLGADYQRLTGDGHSALSLVCEVAGAERWETGRRTANPSRLRIIRRLLQLGVDANIKCPLQYACDANDMALCQLLLLNGADPRARGEDGRLPKELLAAPLRRRFTKLPRDDPPEPLCWCLISGRLLANCHGKEDGMEANPMYGCPFESGELYGECCKKKGVIFHETHDRVFQHHGVAGNALGELDPAFTFAFFKTDFMPKYWKDKLPKNERIARQKKWNDAVDEYILTDRGEDDTRTPREIEEVAKIGADGACLYKSCSYCDAKEQNEGEFFVCGGCRVRVFCSKACQKAHWKEGHKSKCGMERLFGSFSPIDLPSAATMARIMEE